MEARSDSESPLEIVRDCLEHFGHTLGVARSLVQAGKQIDLTGLDAEIGYVCARTLDLPPEEGRSLRPKLIGLLVELDGLSTVLEQRGQPPS